MSRTILPARRRCETAKVTHGNHELTVSFGFSEAGHVVEVFCASGKTGVELTALVTDACILVSLLLQHGVSAENIAASMGENRAEGDADGPAASIIGQIVREAAALEMAKITERSLLTTICSDSGALLAQNTPLDGNLTPDP